MNTAYGGLNDETLVRDTVLAKANRILNRIFFFMIFVDCGDFESEDVAALYAGQNMKYLPNIVVILNKGVIVRASIFDSTFDINFCPEDKKREHEDWYFSPFAGKEGGSMEGNHLGFLYYALVEHLANSYLEPPSLKNYLSKMMVGRKSQLKRLVPPNQR